MDRVNGFPVFTLGATLGALQEHLVPGPVQDIARFVFPAQTALATIAVDQLLRLPLTRTAANTLLDALDPLVVPERLGEKGAKVSIQEAAGIRQLMQHFQSVLFAELGQLDLFYLSRKRAYDMETLISKAEQVLSESAIKSLPGTAVLDIREAGKCLGFEVPTAAGFHIFRAIEAVVLLYFPLLGVTLKDSDRNLGKYITFLEEKKVDPKITGMLRHLKDHYRNPLMHPDEFLSFDEAESLFGFAQSAITVMIADIELIKQNAQQLTLAPVAQTGTP